MKNDPFGNLMDWGPVMDTLEDLVNNGDLTQCQPGLVRILRYKGNWRLREEVLKRIGEIQTPSDELVEQVIAILDDDNLYYDVRIIAGTSLVQLLTKTQIDSNGYILKNAKKIIEKLKSTPQPPFFAKAIDRLHSKLVDPIMLEN